jgi:HIRAN domain
LRTLFLAWQDSISRGWFPVGKLTYQQGLYYFRYIQGALTARDIADFRPILSFPEFEYCYSSPDLFPLFANRLLRRSRPDYPDFVKWLNMPEDQEDPIALLARSGGQRQTDSFEVFPLPEPDIQGDFHIHFFAHGLRYMSPDVQKNVQNLQVGEKLFLMHDMQNAFDSRALVLRTENHQSVGYCPRYLTQDFFELVSRFPEKVKVAVEKVNLSPTPLQFRLLCNLTATEIEDFQPFASATYEPIACANEAVLPS